LTDQKTGTGTSPIGWKEWSLLVILAIIWGSSFIMIKRGLYFFSPIQVASIRILSAALLLAPLSLPALKTIKPSQWFPLITVGAMGSLLPAFLFAMAQSKIPSSMAGILNGLTPLFTLLVGGLFFGHAFHKNRIWGILLGLAGCGFLIFLRSDGQLGEFNFYAILIVLATFCYGTSVNLVNHFFKDLSAKVTSSVSLLTVSPVGLFLMIYYQVPRVLIEQPESLNSFFSILFLGFVSTAIALMLFYKLLKMTNPVFGSSVTYIIPVVALLWGVFDGEKIFFFYLLSLLMILVGVYFISKK
jgi:drug/metabolite transporter (DMT)-like permease